MSAPIVCDKLVEAIESGKYDVIIINFANPDMVGHTGVESAAIKAIETVDACVGRAVEAIKAAGGVLFICADHGNAEVMVDEATGEPWTAHTTNQVPFILVGADPAYKLRATPQLNKTLLRNVCRRLHIIQVLIGKHHDGREISLEKSLEYLPVLIIYPS